MIGALFSPFEIGGLTLRNRIVMSPMTRSFSPGGVPTRDVVEYYRRRAEGECGLIITEGVGVDHPAAIGATTVDDVDIPLISTDEQMAAWREVVDGVHAAGGKIAPQLWHQGVLRKDYTGYGRQAVSSRPSGLWGPIDRKRSPVLTQEIAEHFAQPTRPMTEEEIADVIAAFARSARNSAAVGFDAIALHGAHGYLVDTFLWAETNRRTDRWGGDHNGRTTFAVELVKAVRREIPAEMPVLFRWSQYKQQDFDARLATTAAELEDVLGPISDAGVDIFDVSVRRFDMPAELDDSDRTLAAWTKAVTGKPTIAVGSVSLSTTLYESLGGLESNVNSNVELAAEMIERGEFDLLAVGRMMLANPDYARRVRTRQPLAKFDATTLKTLY